MCNISFSITFHSEQPITFPAEHILFLKTETEHISAEWETGWLSRYGDWLQARSHGSRSLRLGGINSLLCIVQTGSGAHPTSYPIGNGGSFPGSKTDGAWNLPLTSNWCRCQENMGLYIRSPYVFMASD
jgi:hypothetical protein